MQLACNMFTLFERVQWVPPFIPARRTPRTYHAVASTIFSVPKLFVKQILPSISAIFEGERERGGEGQCGAQIAFSVPGSLGPLWDPPTGAQPLQCSTGLVCNPRIRPFALV